MVIKICCLRAQPAGPLSPILVYLYLVGMYLALLVGPSPICRRGRPVLLHWSKDGSNEWACVL